VSLLGLGLVGDWEARAADYEAQIATLHARIVELEGQLAAVSAAETVADDDDAAVMAELQRLGQIADDLKRRVHG
jgi:hypothetical protein